jgi:hypothetical protein
MRISSPPLWIFSSSSTVICQTPRASVRGSWLGRRPVPLDLWLDQLLMPQRILPPAEAVEASRHRIGAVQQGALRAFWAAPKRELRTGEVMVWCYPQSRAPFLPWQVSER